MTSERHILTSCYIFIDIGEAPILAGRYMIDAGGLGHFIYGNSYVHNSKAFPLDPINLPFTEPMQVFHPINGKQAFGVLADGTADNWGRRLITSIHRTVPQNEVEWLLVSHGLGAGCIVASGSETMPKTENLLHSFSEFEQFFTLADNFEAGKKIPKELIRLVDFGSSMGGARPKLTVTDGGKEWIAKINRAGDQFDVCRAEYATMNMAKKCGIEVPLLQLKEIGGRPILLVQRFDRNIPERKRHYISAHSLINAFKVSEKDAAKNYSYMGIADIIKRIAKNPADQQQQLYRRMVFNTLIGNTDDHMKNHGFLMMDYDNKTYSLSPAFDILPHLDALQHMQAIGIGEFGRESSVENLLSAVGRFGLDLREAKLILQEIIEIVQDWQSYFKEAGIRSEDMNILSKVVHAV